MKRHYGLIKLATIGWLLSVIIAWTAVLAATNVTVNRGPGTKQADMPQAGFVLIPPGIFVMGEPEVAEPVHAADIGTFYMEVTEVTKAQWDNVRSWATNNGYSFENTGWGKATNHPVRTVNWYDCVKWCNARTERDFGVHSCCYYTSTTFSAENVYRRGEININNDGVNWTTNGYRLPTESEWEKAARGGIDSIYLPQADASAAKKYSSDAGSTFRCNPQYGHASTPAGSLGANGYGLYDMAGYVWEWCWDWFAGYPSSSESNPPGPMTGSFRIIRGGSWYSYVTNQCPAAGRGYCSPGEEFYYLGFRCARSR